MINTLGDWLIQSLKPVAVDSNFTLFFNSTVDIINKIEIVLAN